MMRFPVPSRMFAEFDRLHDFVLRSLDPTLPERLRADVRSCCGTGVGCDADITETPEGYELTLAVPGMAPETLGVEVAKGVLTIRTVDEAATSTSDNASTSTPPRRVRRFHYTYRLPDTVDAERIEARCVHGLLTVRLPKRAREAGRRIPVLAA